MPTDMGLCPAWTRLLHTSQVMRPLEDHHWGATGRSKIRPLHEGPILSVDASNRLGGIHGLSRCLESRELNFGGISLDEVRKWFAIMGLVRILRN